MPRIAFAPRYPIHALWVSSKSAAGRCGWANVGSPIIARSPIKRTPSVGQWNRASEDFFESFRNYDEAGLPQRIQVLKYLVLANMLTGSEVNPFDSQETKPCVFHPITASSPLFDLAQSGTKTILKSKL
jgi:hypothetical protein